MIECSTDENYLAALAEVTRAAESLDDEEFFTLVAQAMIRWYEMKPQEIRLKLFASLEGHEMMAELHDKQAKPFINVIVGYIGKHVEKGTFQDVSPIGAALAFCGAIGQYCQATILFRSSVCESIDRTEMVKLVVQLFLRGIRKA